MVTYLLAGGVSILLIFINIYVLKNKLKEFYGYLGLLELRT